MTENEVVLVYDWKYLKNASQIYANAFENQKEDLLNLMIWSFLKEKIINLNFLPKNITSKFIEFEKLFSNATSLGTRTLRCAGITSGVMPFTVGQIYVKRNFKNESKTDVELMVENIREEFKSILAKTDWMDDQSKKAALEKVILKF